MTVDPEACDVLNRVDSNTSREATLAGREVSGTRAIGSSEHQSSEARANMYRFFSAVYLSPIDEDLLRQLVDDVFLDELSTLFGEQAVAELRNFAATVSVEEDLPSLRQEYMDLFAVPTGRYVTPFEDVFRGKSAEGKEVRGPLLGERAIAVTRAYRGAGAEMESTCKELPTHVGVELSFMNFLCEREAAAHRNQNSGAVPDREKEERADQKKHRELQFRFLRDHLNQWFPQLSSAIQNSAGGPLYRGLAALTEEFLRHDAAGLVTQAQDHGTPGSLEPE
jgi:TorA maturation chaperone TorD